MDAELHVHLEIQINEYMQQGLSREAAELRARREFGGVELAKEECRDERRFEPMDRFVRELRYAFRSLRNAPGYALTAIMTLALGIGANTAIFSALHGVVLAPLPYWEPDRLVEVVLFNRSLKYATYGSYPDFLDWQRSSRSFEQIAAVKPAGFDLTNPGSPEHVEGYEVSSAFFRTLGVNLTLGRSFSSGEEQSGGMPAAIISNRMWQERFHGSPSVLGKAVTLNGAGYTIIGVLPPAFRFENQVPGIFTAIGHADPFFRFDRTVHDLFCVARLSPGVTLGRAQAELNTVQERIDELNPTTERGQATFILPLKQSLVGDVRDTLWLLLGAVGVVLLIACANVANLLLARSAARTREFAVRRALGASRMQIICQLITESLVVSSAGGVLGLLIAKLGLKVILAAVPGGLPRTENVGLNVYVLLFALVLSVAVGILFGLIPALKHANAGLQWGIREGGRGSTSRQRTQSVLAVAQVALALVLLSGAGLLFRTIRNLWAVNPGYDTRNVITFQIGFSPSVTETPASTRAAYQQITENLREIPGVESADLTALVPLGRGDNSGPFWRGAHPPISMAQIPRALYYGVGPDYPRTMQIPLLRGRYLTLADTVNSQLVILIDSLMARRFFSDTDPLGQTITIPHWGHLRDVPGRIVGIVGHVQQYGLDGSSGEKPQLYFSFYQLPDDALSVFRNEITFAVRTRVEPGALMAAIKNAVHRVTGDEPVYNVRTMRDLVSGSIAHHRFPMILLVAFAVLAFVLATIGIYGLISYSTTQRVPEIGIRMAVGASKGDVLQMLLAHGLRLALVGVALGAVTALILTKVLASFSHLLYGVRERDPLTFVAVSVCLMLAALLACYIPARRAARVDPMIALRHD